MKPRGRPKKQVEQTEESKKLFEVLDSLAYSVKGLTERIEKLENKPIETKTEIPTEMPKEETKFPVPMEYRDIVDTILNKSFGLKIEPLTDRPAFTMIVIVPDKYSNISAAEKEMHKVDLRSKVIDYAEGANGVRTWAEQVYNNLNPEIQAQIVADRAELK